MNNARRKLTDEERKALIPYTTRRTVLHWGLEHEVTPVMISTGFGDAKQLLAFSTVNSRPKYYLILIDSKVDVETNAIYADFDDEFPNCIYSAIADEFGDVADRDTDEEAGGSPCDKINEGQDCDNCAERGVCEWTKWPTLDSETGCEWWEVSAYNLKAVSK